MSTRVIPLLLLLAASPLIGQEHPRWRIHVGTSWVQGLEIASAPPATVDPSLAPLTDRVYDDGFNRVDATNNLGDGPGGVLPTRTGYFSFLQDSQVDLAADTLTLSKLGSPADAGGSPRKAADGVGFSLAIRYDFVPQRNRWHFGLAAAMDWQARETATHRYDEATQARLVSDRYRLGGVVPQRAPYTGHFTPQPGDQRIGDTPERTITTVSARATGTEVIEHRTMIARAGVWCERRLDERVSLFAEAGVASGSIDVESATLDTLSAGSGRAVARAYSASGDATPWGWYAGAGLSVDLSTRWALEASWTFADLGVTREGPLRIDASSLGLLNVRASWRF